MPTLSPAHYLTKIDSFIGHWTDVDAALSPGALTLLGPYGLADLTADRAALATEMANLQGFINDWEGHRMDRDNRKTAVRERMRQFGNMAEGALAGTNYSGHIPALVKYNSNSHEWDKAMDDTLNTWGEINTTPPAGYVGPLVLFGPYTLANFTTDVDALRDSFTGVNQSLGDSDLSRKERDLIWERVYDRLVQYRLAVPGYFPSDHPLSLSLPRLTPAAGHTPEAVVLTGNWNAMTTKADLSWTASDDDDFDHYELRVSVMEPYDTDTETVLENFPAGTLAYSTDVGLIEPGAKRSYKVYVVLTTDNEKGSNPVTVQNTTMTPPPDPEP